MFVLKLLAIQRSFLNHLSNSQTVNLITVEENIISTIKMRNHFCYPLKMVIFPILRQQYWTFSIAPHLVIALPTLRQQKLSLLISLLQFLYEFCRLVHGFFSVLLPIQLSASNYWDSNSCRSFSLLKTIAKRLPLLFANSFKSIKERQLSRQLEER